MVIISRTIPVVHVNKPFKTVLLAPHHICVLPV